MISFALYILAISITIQYTLAQNPVCDGTQIVYATPPIDPLTGLVTGAGLNAITLSVDEDNTVIANVIGIASDPTELTPDQQGEIELIRSASINPLTTDLVLLYQEMNPADPMMNEPRQRLVIIPGFKLNSLLVQSPGILGYEIDEAIDLAETELDEEYPLTEIAFDCAGNLLGVTAQGELVQMIIEPGSQDLETRYIGPIAFQGGLVGLITGFVGLTYDFQTNTFIAVGGLPVANTLVQFAVCECEIFQIGNPVIITDEFGLCPLGIVDIESRGNNQFYVTCAIDAMSFGLAMLELVNGIAEILPLNAAEGASLVPLPNSSGGAIIPSIPSGTTAADVNVNAICFPRNIGSPFCNVVPTESDCEGDITIQLLITPPGAADICRIGANGALRTGINIGPVSGSYGNGVPAYGGDYASGGAGAYDVGAAGLGTSVNGEVVPGTAGTGFGGLGLGVGVGIDGNSVEFGDDTDLESEEEEEATNAETDTESEEEEEDPASADTDASDDDEDTSADDDSEDDDTDGDDTSADDESEDDDDTEEDDDDDEDDIDDEGDVSDDDEDTDNESSDGGSDDEDSMDGDGDESVDDDDETDRDSVDPFQFDFERGSAEDAQLNGNNFHRNGFLAQDGYGNDGQGTMISLSPSTLANLWGLAMIFLGINLTFLCICYYRNGQCQKKQVTIDDNAEDGDIESL